MPIGIIVDSTCVALGGVLGAVLGNRVKESFNTTLNLMFAVSAMAMGISNIVLMKNMTAVILAVILGAVVGMALKLGQRITSLATKANLALNKNRDVDENQMASLVTIVVLFCASGTGIYGSMVSGISGDHSILITKAVLDFFTAMVFACSLGKVVSYIAIPQCVIFLALFYLAKFIIPFATDTMICDFKAMGGIILLATAFNLMRAAKYPTADMIPCLVLVMPFSWLWTTFIAPLF